MNGTGWLEAPHDPRSLNFAMFAAAAAPTQWPQGRALHPTTVHVNQGQHGICVGASLATWLASAPSPKHADIDLARSIFKRAVVLDPWPENDDREEGTSVLAGMKAAKEMGLIGDYHWLFGAVEVCTALLRSPVILGIPWFDGMQKPIKGVIKATGERIGGHAIAAVGYDSTNGMVTLHNTWGPTWGLAGRCKIHRDDLAQLLTGRGEAVVPTKI